MPETVFTGVESVALPLATQGEVNVTETGTVAGAPLIHTAALTLLLP